MFQLRKYLFRRLVVGGEALSLSSFGYLNSCFQPHCQLVSVPTTIQTFEFTLWTCNRLQRKKALFSCVIIQMKSRIKRSKKPGRKQCPAPKPKRLKQLSSSESASSPARKRPRNQKSDSGVEASSESSESSGNEESSSPESESSSEGNEPALKTMEFRKRRGEKMNYLINRRKEQEEDDDDFWKNNKYFGENDNLDKDDEEDYVESSSGRDEFDSDFLSSEKEKQDDQDQEQEEDEDDSEKHKKRKAPHNIEPKKPTKKVKKAEPQKQKQKESSYKYIHEEYTQEQLLAEAAHTEYFNLISLRKLVSLEEEKKFYQKREHTLDPPKLVYKDTFRDGERVETITLVGFEPGTSLFDIKDPV